MRTSLVVYLLIALAVCAELVLFTLKRQDRNRAQYFTVITIALTFYVVGYLLECFCTNAQMVFVALCVENVGIPMIAPFFLLAVLSLYHARILRRWMIGAAFLYGLFFFLCVLFNGQHEQYYTSIQMVQSGADSFLRVGHGPLYAAQRVCSLLFMLVAVGVAVRRYVVGTRMMRAQMQLILLGFAVVICANLVYVSGVLPVGLDPMPFALIVMMILICVNIYRQRLLDIVPLASLTAVDTMEDAMVVLDIEHGYQFSNRAAKTLFPALSKLFGNEKVEGIEGWPKELLAQESPGEVAFVMVDKSGSAHNYRVRVSAVLDGKENTIGWTYLMRDITENTQMIRQLEEMATTDPLTGVYNRRQFLSMVNHELEVAARLWLNMSLIMYDLDNFKRINDTYGHVAGDYVLCAVADVVKNQLRPYDIFARYGGEEFVIFTTATEHFDLAAFANRLRSAIENAEIVYEGQRIRITASFGAVFIKPKIKFATALRAVDTAMYRAKTMGRNKVEIAEIQED